MGTDHLATCGVVAQKILVGELGTQPLPLATGRYSTRVVKKLLGVCKRPEMLELTQQLTREQTVSTLVEDEFGFHVLSALREVPDVDVGFVRNTISQTLARRVPCCLCGNMVCEVGGLRHCSKRCEGSVDRSLDKFFSGWEKFLTTWKLSGGTAQTVGRSFPRQVFLRMGKVPHDMEVVRRHRSNGR